MSMLRRLASKVQLFSAASLFSKISVDQGVVNKLWCHRPAVLVNLEQSRDYKVKTRLRKRCKSCYFVWRNGRLYVECQEHPRHKQHHVSSMLRGYDNIPHGYHVPNIK